jgi:hypothetical protein
MLFYNAEAKDVRRQHEASEVASALHLPNNSTNPLNLNKVSMPHPPSCVNIRQKNRFWYCMQIWDGSPAGSFAKMRAPLT